MTKPKGAAVAISRRNDLSRSLRTASLILCALCVLCGKLSAQAPPATQTLVLPSGWNLISIQVGSSPMPVDDFRNAFSDPSQIAEIWGYQASGSASQPGSWDFTKEPPLPGLDNEVDFIEQGKGYWVRVANGTATAALTGPVWSGTVAVLPGWNLVGFPGLVFGENEEQELSAVFGSDFDRIQQVWTFDTSGQQHVGYDVSAIPELEDLTGVSAGLGYWVYSIDGGTIDLAPDPFIALPPDSDASPPEPAVPYVPGSADDAIYTGLEVRYTNPDGTDDPYDANANGILDDAETQDTIHFEKTAGTATITIGNKGSGALAWTLENSIPWLFTVAPDEKVWPDNAGRPQSASGTVSNDRDLVILYIDRRGLNPGTVGPETMTLWIGDQPKVISVKADVADVSGDWTGFATTTRVNGQDITLGEVRLAMNAFLNDGETEGSGFRAVVDREKAILFPRDVFLEGVFYSEKDFQLTTNYEMPAGDRNAPPFETFPGDPDDIDTNGDGRVDVMNPFPYGIRREVTLLGTRVSPDRLEGTYVESIRGMLPPLADNTLTSVEADFVSEEFLTTSQAVVVEGEFVLERDSFEPTKRSVFNETATVDAPLGGTDVQVRTQTLDVGTSFTVQGVTLSLDLDFPEPALMRILLISPDGTIYIVHDFGDPTLPDANTLIPTEIFQGEQGFGDWQLQIQWDTTERGTWNSWGLNIEGVSTHAVTGTVVAQGGGALTDVKLRLEGSVQPQEVTSPDGSFSLSGLTENDYTLFISKPGYQDKAVTFFIGEDDVALGQIELTPLAITEPELRAAPPIGFEPFTSELAVLTPPASTVDEVSWDFGDGSPVLSGTIADLAEVEHEFDGADLFTVTVTLKDGGVEIPESPLTLDIHVHRARADASLNQPQVVLGTFLGSLGARMDPPAATANTPPVPDANQLPDFDNSDPDQWSAAVYQETKWDVGSFDIDRFIWMAENEPPGFDRQATADRFPYLSIGDFPKPFSPNEEDTDFSGQRYVYYDPVSQSYKARDWQSGDPTYDLSAGIYSTYEIPAGSTKPTRFRMATKLGGAVFSPQLQSLGNRSFQPGRTLK